MPATADRARLFAFCALVVAAILTVAVYARFFRAPEERDNRTAFLEADNPAQLANIREHAYLLFRNTALGPAYGRVAAVPLDVPNGKRFVTPLSCDRVHATRAAGLCLSASRGVFTSYRADAFDRDFKVVGTFALEGLPSRTRVSADGSVAGATVFVSGDSYAVDSFSTRTTLFDLKGAKRIANLEDFSVERNGRPFKRADFNFWGVTFSADPDQFFAVLASAGRLYLVKGQVSARHLRVIREGLECPSLSPDGQRIAFKVRTFEGARLVWRLHVLDLHAKAESVVNEPRNVDDQAEWLDAEHVLYALPRESNGDGSSDVWVARADGGGVPRVLVSDAFSPSVVRP
jgi:WD40-like Beta Propeller Repeat